MSQKSDLITELEYFIDMVNTRHQTTPDRVYTSIYDFMLKEGKLYTSQELTEQEQKIVNEAIENLDFIPKQKECYKNAQNLIFSDKTNEIKYIEGNCRIGAFGFNIHHAFNEINGKVIDITWSIKYKDRPDTHIFGYFPKQFEYFGVNFSKRQILNRVHDTNHHTSLIENNRELLTKLFQP